MQYFQAKGALPPPPDLLPVTWASPASDWFVKQRFIIASVHGKQQRDRLPGGLSHKASCRAGKAVEEGGFSRKPGALRGLRSGRRVAQAYSATGFLP
ncbi:MAG: hypothetical protein AB2598_03800 [Candidatus Thiodiazotropha sp.]